MTTPARNLRCAHCDQLDPQPLQGLCRDCTGIDGRATLCRRCCPTGHGFRPAPNLAPVEWALRGGRCAAGRPGLRCILPIGPHLLHPLRPEEGYTPPFEAERTTEEGILDAHHAGYLTEDQAAGALLLDRLSLRERADERGPRCLRHGRADCREPLCNVTERPAGRPGFPFQIRASATMREAPTLDELDQSLHRAAAAYMARQDTARVRIQVAGEVVAETPIFSFDQAASIELTITPTKGIPRRERRQVDRRRRHRARRRRTIRRRALRQIRGENP